MGSSEKISLKWNDSKSFLQLRQQTGLFDVTLVSSNQRQVSAHKVVLSACSDFFKNIFHRNTHSHPLLYLDGVDHEEINLMLDYIYQGEVQIYQDYLDRFLNIANKFKLDAGLLASEESSMKYKTEEQIDNDMIITQEQQNPPPIKVVRQRPLKVVYQSVSQFEELVVKENNMYRCTVCQKTMSHKTNMKNHLEVHLTGLSYECQLCEMTFRSNNLLSVHKTKYHK